MFDPRPCPFTVRFDCQHILGSFWEVFSASSSTSVLCLPMIRALGFLPLLPWLYYRRISSRCSTTNIMEPHSRRQQDGEEKMPLQAEDIRPEIKDDLYDPSYQDEEGPPPKLEYVWRNIILMVLLLVGALYGITLVPSCKVYTWLLGNLQTLRPGPAPHVSPAPNSLIR